MKPIYCGFDGLEFAVKAIIPTALDAALAKTKASAKEFRQDQCYIANDVWLVVKESGARGGYAYSCSEANSGNWFFKKPSPGDAWGVRFSAASSALALHGLEGLRLRCDAVLKALGIHAPVEAYSPSRVDFAIDFLAPDFAVSPKNFVLRYSNTGTSSHDIFEDRKTNGRSGRTTSVTVGKMPGRQAIIYDKREEVIVHRKHEWPAIWGRMIDGPHAPPLDLTERATSQIWRVELRSGKRHLKDDWAINSWASLYQMLPRVFEKLMDDLSYCAPTADTNRSRWPEHDIWKAVRKAVANDLFTHIPNLSPEDYTEVKRAQKLDELETQKLGLSISIAAIEGCYAEKFEAALTASAANMVRRANTDKRSLHARLDEARIKYAYLRD
ncbi:hypothetical protein [Loktanella sp. 3ANDIMAR09]|uniref:hypothetical protein n=1 Tax=Loktanella sp. 3ANDIMAR09 TaxID=1225657 RepID=UPI000B181B12|nr:hypothetical protein [Loktanella sp. 3ANDIMAR09]